MLRLGTPLHPLRPVRPVHCVNQEQVETWLKSTVRPKAQKGRGVQPHRDDFPLTLALTPVLPNSHVSSQRDVIGKREHACKLEIIIYSSNICVLQRSGGNSVSNPSKRRRQSKLPDFRPMACTYAYCKHSLPSRCYIGWNFEWKLVYPKNNMVSRNTSKMEDNLLNSNVICRQKCQKEIPVWIVSFDLSKAFDTVKRWNFGARF